MGDDNQDQQGKPTGGQLRAQLEQALADKKALEGEMAMMKATLRFHDAGLGGLSEVKRKMLLSVVDDPNAVTADQLKELAKEAGWAEAPPTPTPPNGTNTPPPDPNTNSNTQGSGEGEGPDAAAQMMAAAAAAGISEQEVAHLMGMRGKVDPRSFEDRMAKAETYEEVVAAIQQAGPSVGIMWEDDTR